MFAERLLGCEGDGNAGVGSGGGVVVVSAYMGGRVCDMCMCLARGRVVGVGGEWVTGLGLGLPILEEHEERGICVCVLVVVVLGESGWAVEPKSGRVGWCYVCVCCEFGLYVLMAGSGICILC